MSGGSHAIGLAFREWQRDRDVDRSFLRLVPPVKWDYFACRLRPLADDCAAGVWKALFTGVVRPFHYQRAKGWMAKVFRTVTSAPDWHKRGLTVDQALVEAFGAARPGPVLLAYSGQTHPVYAAEWPVILDCLSRGWLMASDTFVLCAEETQSIALFWEGTGPYFGKRGDRCLTTRCT